MAQTTVIKVNLTHEPGACWLTIKNQEEGVGPWLSAVRLEPDQLRAVLNDGLHTVRKVVDAESTPVSPVTGKPFDDRRRDA